MSRKMFDWTPERYTALRKAWRERPLDQAATAFDRRMGIEFGTEAKTIQRCRLALGYKSNPRRVTS